MAVGLPAFNAVNSGSYLCRSWSHHCWFGHRIIETEGDFLAFNPWAGHTRLGLILIQEEKTKLKVNYEQENVLQPVVLLDGLQGLGLIKQY